MEGCFGDAHPFCVSVCLSVWVGVGEVCVEGCFGDAHPFCVSVCLSVWVGRCVWRGVVEMHILSVSLSVCLCGWGWVGRCVWRGVLGMHVLSVADAQFAEGSFP